MVVGSTSAAADCITTSAIHLRKYSFIPHRAIELWVRVRMFSVEQQNHICNQPSFARSTEIWMSCPMVLQNVLYAFSHLIPFSVSHNVRCRALVLLPIVCFVLGQIVSTSSTEENPFKNDYINDVSTHCWSEIPL